MDNQTQLRKKINEALANCLRAATPNVCELAETKSGYHQVENQMITLMVTRQITAHEAILTIEDQLT
jgi:hypothetical protein